MRSIKIDGRAYRFYGAIQNGRRIVTDAGDFILNTVSSDGKQRFSVLPVEQEPIEIEAVDFLPWMKVPITKEDEPEIRGRTEAHKKKLLSTLARREKETKALSLENFVKHFGDGEDSGGFDPAQRHATWIRENLKAIAIMKKPYLGGYKFAGESKDYTENDWLREFGDSFKVEKWTQTNGKNAYEEKRKAIEGLVYQIAYAEGFDLGAEHGFEKCIRYIARIHYVAKYPREMVYLESLDRNEHCLEATQLIAFAERNAPAQLKAEASPAQATSVPAPEKELRLKEVTNLTGWSKETVDTYVEKGWLRPRKTAGKSGWRFFKLSEIGAIQRRMAQEQSKNLAQQTGWKQR